MAATILKHAAEDDQTGWKTEEYHGKQMHVCAEPRVPESEALSGHGLQWTFKVKITENDPGRMDDKGASAKSDLGLFYSTQAIAEGMGFVRGRELIEGAGLSSADGLGNHGVPTARGKDNTGAI